jgi:asparagine synthase (glutamine-hydrolysing)
MCGIAGYLGTRELDPIRIQACLDCMGRRGPDQAAWRDFTTGDGRHVYLLHSRLSIIDLDSRANQPFSRRGRWLIYNGELYNYLELKRELESQGRVFSTTSDTEVLMEVLIKKGWAGLDGCEGMWAFAFYDEEKGSLLLCRDRFGEKPLYLYRDADGLYFGSEIKFIATLAGKQLRPNYGHLYRYLVNGYKSLYKVKDTFFEGVWELPPASILHLEASGRETARRYWTPAWAPDDSLTYPEAVAGVRERLIRSVDWRLRADVPLAFCMSGGVDSVSLISIAKKVLDYDVHGFTVMVEDERYDEGPLVEQAVRRLGLRHTPVNISSHNFLDNLRELIRQHDAPIYTISYYVHWLLMQQIAAAGYRISVSGTGADELLTGYYDHHNLFLYETRDTSLGDLSLIAWQANVAPLVRNPYLQNSCLFFEDPQFRDHIYLNSDVFAQYLTRHWREPFQEESYTSSILRNRLLNELFHEVVPVILHEDDLNAMYFSIENRSPFLDRNLVEFCCRIPAAFLIRDGYAKAILREAMEGIAPPEVLWNRRKVGFNAPIFSFLDVRDRSVRAWLLDDGPIFQHVRRDKIAHLLQRRHLPNSDSKFLFNFVCAKAFLEEFA